MINTSDKLLLSKADLCEYLGISSKTLKKKLQLMIEALQITPEEYRRIKIFTPEQSIYLKNKLGINGTK
jgi:hypothetical protein